MERKEFIKKSTMCGVLSFLCLALPDKLLNSQTIKTNNENAVNNVNREQITRLLDFIDSELDDPIKKEVFGKLGYECFYCTKAVTWIKSMNLTRLIETVNNGNSSRWERIEYIPENGILKVIGRKAPCNCAYSQAQKSPKSLCNYCCKNFLKELFGTLFEKKITVTINDSIILGGERCSATINIC
jgi:hypothetical protein